MRTYHKTVSMLLVIILLCTSLFVMRPMSFAEDTQTSVYIGESISLSRETKNLGDSLGISVRGTEHYYYDKDHSQLSIFEAGSFQVEIKENNKILETRDIRVLPIQVKVRIEATDHTIYRPEIVTINSLLVQEGIDYYKTLDLKKPTAFHAIKELQKKHGVSVQDKSQFNAGDTGSWIQTIAGVPSEGNGTYMYAVNHKIAATGIAEQEVQDNDYIVVYILGSTAESSYCYFDKEEQTVQRGTPFEAVVRVNGIDDPSGISLMVDDKLVDAKTNSEGKVFYRFTENGVYHLSTAKYNLEGENQTSRAYMTLTVEDPILKHFDLRYGSQGSIIPLDQSAEQTISTPDILYENYFRAVSNDGSPVSISYMDEQGQEVTKEIGNDFVNATLTKYRTHTYTFRKGEKPFVVHRKLIPTLKDIKLYSGDKTLALDKPFLPETKEYELSISASDEELLIVPESFLESEEQANAKQEIYVNGELVTTSHSLKMSGLTQLNIHILNGVSGLTSDYSIRIKNQDTVPFTVRTLPKHAAVILADENGHFLSSDEKSVPGEYHYQLVRGKTYTYHASLKGYRAKEGRFTVSDPGLSVTLEKANDVTLPEIDSFWPQMRKDALNNAVISSFVPRNSEEAKLKWSSTIGERHTNPIIVDHHLMIAAEKTLYKINKETGETVASVSLSAPVEKGSYLTSGAGMIFVPAGKRIHAFDAKTLQAVWQSDVLQGGEAIGPLYYHDGYLYGVSGQLFYALEVRDAEPNHTDEVQNFSWIHPIKNGMGEMGAIVQGDYVIIGDEDGKLRALNRFNGVLSSSFEVEGSVRSSIVSNQYALYFTTDPGILYRVRFDKETGKFLMGTLRSIKIPNAEVCTSTPVIVNGRVYVGAGPQGTYAVLNAESLKAIYHTTMETDADLSLIGAASTAYQGKTFLLALTKAITGELLTIEDGVTQNNALYKKTYLPSSSDAGSGTNSPIADENGTVYCTNDKGRLLAIERIHKVKEIISPKELTIRVHSGGDTIPSQFKAKVDNNTSIDVTVTWNSDYNLSKIGTYVLKGTVHLPPGYSADQEKLTITMKLNVQSATIRLAGKDRFLTAREASMHTYSRSDYAIIVNGEKYPDALSAAVLARDLGAPILLVNDQKIPLATNLELFSF